MLEQRTYLAQGWSGLGTLASPTCGSQVVYEPTFEVTDGHVTLRAIEASPNVGYLTRAEAGRVGAPIPFTGRMLVSLMPTPQVRADDPERPPLALHPGSADLSMASDIRDIVFTRGAVEAVRSLGAAIGELLTRLGQKSDTNQAVMRSLLERRPLPRGDARALLERASAEAEHTYRRWAEEHAVSADYALETPAVGVAVGPAADLLRRAERRAWAERPRAQRDVEGPRLRESSRPILEALAQSAPRATRVAGRCPRCAKGAELRVCRSERFVICDDCWFAWW